MNENGILTTKKHSLRKLSLPYYLLLLILLLFVSNGLDYFAGSGKAREWQMHRIQRIFLHKEKNLKEKVNRVAEMFSAASEKCVIPEEGLNLLRNVRQKDVTILVYRNDSLCYWSDNSSDYPVAIKADTLNHPLLKLGNAYYASVLQKKEPYTVMGLILIKHLYPYENKYLRNTFNADFHLPSSVGVAKAPLDELYSFPLKNEIGTNVLYFCFDTYQLKNHPIRSFIPWLYAVFGLLLILFVRKLLYQARSAKEKWVIFLAYFVAGVLLRIVMIQWQWPAVLYRTSLFSPAHFAAGHALPSLGDLLLNAVFTFSLAYFVFRHISCRFFLGTGKKLLILQSFLYHLVFVAIAVFLHLLFDSLVIDSDISFEIRNIPDLTVFTFIGLFSIALLFVSVGLIYRRFAEAAANAAISPKVFVSSLVLAMGILPVSRIAGVLSLAVFIFVVSLFIVHSVYYRKRNVGFSFYVILILLFSLYTVIIADRAGWQKEWERGKVIATGLAAEHDPVAELMLGEIAPALASDTLLPLKLQPSVFRYDDLDNYLQRRYFGGYWARYDIQFTICDADDSLLVQPENRMTHCYSFFSDMLNNYGYPLSDTGFYYLNNQNGRISYFGRFRYKVKPRNEETDLFVQITSRQIIEAPGYPELLLDEKTSSALKAEGYAYAKYYKGQLITQSGKYPYSLVDTMFRSGEEFALKKIDNFQHIVFRPSADNLIVLSKPVPTFFEKLTAFSYVFIFYFLSAAFFLLFTSTGIIESAFKRTFRNRIQYSMIFLLLLSLFLLGGGAVYFSLRQYNARHTEALKEKMQSVYFELYRYVHKEKSLSPDWASPGFSNPDELLAEISNMFYCDINLYDRRGFLIATSRPEIFHRHLAGNLMQPDAYREMQFLHRAEFIQKEQTGTLSYFSAYVPLRNNAGEFLAYLNLPYFTRQNQLAADISNLIVALVNIYLLLVLLSVSLAVLLSRQITLPLRMIQERMAQVKLDRKSEPIDYPGMDEIAGLVNEYNRMVIALEQSAELLARSERELAWREMARQIAHEIRNPLTPMKLSIQHLQRAWEDKSPHFDDLLRRTASTLAEQIDILSYIAASFSSFASIPQGKAEPFNLVDILRSTTLLFEGNESARIQLELNGLEKALVMADKEQISRVLTNLVKNALQAIPSDRKGIVVLEIRKTNEGFRIMVADNGAGIPEEMQGRLFQPNFTTKTTGMGLGLAISKRIIEHAGGKIWFETQPGKGTQFYITLPALQNGQ